VRLCVTNYLCLIVFGINVSKYGWSQIYVSIFVYFSVSTCM
jgi:hypothetical protein